MIRDFATRIEMLSYVEKRIFVDVDKYGKILMRIGDIFRPSPNGIYNENNGDCIVDFGKGYFFRDKRGQKIYITDYNTFNSVNNDIYDHRGFMTLRKENLRRVTICDERPMFFTARFAAAALVAYILKNNHDYFCMSSSVPDLSDCLFEEVFDTDRGFSGRIRNLETIIHKDINLLLDEHRWNELYMQSKSGTFTIDVLLDIRIKDYYERKFDKEDQDIEDENSHDGYYQRKR